MTETRSLDDDVPAFARQALQAGRLGTVSLDHGDVAVVLLEEAGLALPAVQHRQLMAATDTDVHEVRPEEAGAAEQQDAQRCGAWCTCCRRAGARGDEASGGQRSLSDESATGRHSSSFLNPAILPTHTHDG